MGALCQAQKDLHRHGGDNQIKLVGFGLNSDTYAMQLVLKKARLEFDYAEINMLKGEQDSEEFKTAHPSGVIPILEDKGQIIYGSTFIMMAHIAGKYKNVGERLIPKEFKVQISREYDCFESGQKRMIKILRRMLIA